MTSVRMLCGCFVDLEKVFDTVPKRAFVNDGESCVTCFGWIRD